MGVTEHHEDLAEIKAQLAAACACASALEEKLDRLLAAYEQQPPLLAFVHIPKTAGATTKVMLANAYSRDAVRDAGNYVTGESKTEQRVAFRSGGWDRWRQRGGRATVGHVPYGLYRRYLPADTRYMTFLREPVERVLSYYHRHLRLTGTGIDRHRQRRGLPLVSSLEEAFDRRLPEVCNIATRFLCGDPSPLGALPDAALDVAKENLRAFAFVGIQERFEESIVLLQRRLGLGLVPYVDLHVSDDRLRVEDLSPELHLLIREHNQLDAELYEFALGLFDEAVAAADEGFADDVQALRALAAHESEQAIGTAQAWVERALPRGAARPRDEVYAAAAADGVSRVAIRHAFGALSLRTDMDEDGRVVFVRAGDAD
jgi:hypothetical protein